MKMFNNNEDESFFEYTIEVYKADNECIEKFFMSNLT